jgi:hypothetical protein
VDERVLQALRRNRTIDVTSIGAKSGRAQRIEIWAWVAGGTGERRSIFQKLRPPQVDAWTAGSPLVQVEFTTLTP